MEAQLTPALSYPAQAYAQSFFEEVPVDSRFISTSYMKFPPSSTIDAKKLSSFCHVLKQVIYISSMTHVLKLTV